MKPKGKLVIVPDNGATMDVLASEIRRISQGIKALRKGALNDRALILLIQHAIVNPSTQQPVSQQTIKRVLEGMASLESEYLRK
jgi:hypothetical protein